MEKNIEVYKMGKYLQQFHMQYYYSIIYFFICTHLNLATGLKINF